MNTRGIYLDWLNKTKFNVKNTDIFVDSAICLAYYFVNTRDRDDSDDDLDSKKFNRRAINVCAANSTSGYGRKGLAKKLRIELEKEMSRMLFRKAVSDGAAEKTEDKVTDMTPLVDALVEDPELIKIGFASEIPMNVLGVFDMQPGDRRSLFSFVTSNFNNLNSGMAANLYRRLMFDNLRNGYIASSVYTSENDGTYYGSKVLAAATLMSVLLYAGSKSVSGDSILVTLDNQSFVCMASLPEEREPDPQDCVFITEDFEGARKTIRPVENIIRVKDMEMYRVRDCTGTDSSGASKYKDSAVTLLNPFVSSTMLPLMIDQIKSHSTAANAVIVTSDGEVGTDMEVALESELSGCDIIEVRNYADADMLRKYGTLNAVTRKDLLTLLKDYISEHGDIGVINRLVYDALSSQLRSV